MQFAYCSFITLGIIKCYSNVHALVTCIAQLMCYALYFAVYNSVMVCDWADCVCNKISIVYKIFNAPCQYCLDEIITICIASWLMFSAIIYHTPTNSMSMIVYSYNCHQESAVVVEKMYKRIKYITAFCIVYFIVFTLLTLTVMQYKKQCKMHAA